MTSRIEYYDEAQEAFTHALTTKIFNENDDNHFFIGWRSLVFYHLLRLY